jgi:acetyl-CoA carboxylase biotin carboxyl carrier protein
MSNKNITYQDLVQIIDLIKSSSHFDEFHLKTDDLEVDIKRNTGNRAKLTSPGIGEDASLPANSSSSTSASKLTAPPKQPPEPLQATTPERKGQRPTPHTTKTTGVPQEIPADAILIKAPMVGTFYRASEPGGTPFVEIGQQVDEDATVCLIEVMKLINSISAGQRGTVTHIFVADGEPVEYGQTLMALAAA